MKKKNRVFRVIKKRRTIRKFKEKPIAMDILKKCLLAGSMAPSAGNLQPLEFILVEKMKLAMSRCLRWAAYLEEAGPRLAEELPYAYIVVISNKKISADAKYDVGLAVANIVLTATAENVATCIIGNIDRENLAILLELPKNYQIELAVALGYSAQKSKATSHRGSPAYFFEKGVLRVPKKNVGKISHKEFFKRHKEEK